MDYERAFFRLKRALAHVTLRNHAHLPECAGCQEAAAFLAIPGYQGNADYPVGVDFDRPL